MLKVCCFQFLKANSLIHFWQEHIIYFQLFVFDNTKTALKMLR